MVLRALLLVALAPGWARADRTRTRDALDRLEEILELRQEDGLLQKKDVLPAILVSAAPRYEASRGWFPTQATATLVRAFGAGGVRACEACMGLRTVVADGRLEQSSGPIALDEIIALDDRYRGESARARTAIWLDETAAGVSLRVTDLRSARIVFAQNVDPELREYRGSARSYRLSAELERRTRGDSLTHAIYDVALYPGQHVSLEWADQWGDTNANLAGVVLSAFDPILGVGATYHRALEWGNILVGGQLIMSLPTILAQTQVGEDAEITDPAFTGVFMLRVPFGSSNYAGLLSASTNGSIGVGISLLNTSFLPVLP